MEIAIFAGGCFWCTEAVFQRVRGVEHVRSGYIGGHVPEPSYEQICRGTTGHAEAIEITFDPNTVSFENLLEIFFKTHDPTTLNRQGNDVGTQYRSAVFFHNEQQRLIAEEIISELNASGTYESPIVTEVTEATTFFEAEAYHQNYYRDNPGNGYCQFVVRGKVEKVEKLFRDRLKDSR